MANEKLINYIMELDKIILNENETQTTKNKNSIENIESTKDLNTNDELIKSIDVQFSNEILNNHENKKKNYDCAPVPFLSLNMPKLNLKINKDNNDLDIPFIFNVNFLYIFFYFLY